MDSSKSQEEARNAFPDWICKFDPVLARAEHNGLYQCFRLRRTGYSDSIWRRIKRRMNQLDLTGCALVIGAILAFMACNVFAILLYFGYKWFHKRNWSRERIRRSGELPMHASALPAFADAWRDLWLTEANGYTLAEAVYLEHRETAAEAAILATALLFLVIAAIYYFLGEMLSLRTPFFYIALSFLCYQVFLIIITGGISSVRREALDKTIEHIRRSFFADQIIARFVRDVKQTIPAIVVITASIVYLMIMMFGFAVMEDLSRSPSDGLLGYIMDYRLSISFTVHFFVIGVLLFLCRKWLSRKSLTLLQNRLTAAGFCYEVLYGYVVEDDPDVARWAEWIMDGNRTDDMPTWENNSGAGEENPSGESPDS